MHIFLGIKTHMDPILSNIVNLIIGMSLILKTQLTLIAINLMQHAHDLTAPEHTFPVVHCLVGIVFSARAVMVKFLLGSIHEHD